jgi:hypothetical protein
LPHRSDWHYKPSPVAWGNSQRLPDPRRGRRCICCPALNLFAWLPAQHSTRRGAVPAKGTRGSQSESNKCWVIAVVWHGLPARENTAKMAVPRSAVMDVAGGVAVHLLFHAPAGYIVFVGDLLPIRGVPSTSLRAGLGRGRPGPLDPCVRRGKLGPAKAGLHPAAIVARAISQYAPNISNYKT